MIRTLLYLLGGILLGGVIHIIVILALPSLTEETLWTRVQALGALHKTVLLDVPTPGEPNPFGLDPELSYALCQIDLDDGPSYIRGTLPDAFWSLAVYNQHGIVIYSTTNRDGIGQTLDLGLFNANQTRLLAQQQLDIEEGLLIIEASSDALFVLVRLAPPHQAMRQRFETALSAITCGTTLVPQ